MFVLQGKSFQCYWDNALRQKKSSVGFELDQSWESKISFCRLELFSFPFLLLALILNYCKAFWWDKNVQTLYFFCFVLFAIGFLWWEGSCLCCCRRNLFFWFFCCHFLAKKEVSDVQLTIKPLCFFVLFSLGF